MSKNRESESGFEAYTIKSKRNESATKQDYIRYEIRVQWSNTSAMKQYECNKAILHKIWNTSAMKQKIFTQNK